MAVIDLTSDNFSTEVLHSKTPVLVDFWAAWCGPCRMAAPIIEQIAEDYDGKIVVGKLNVDDAQDIAVRYNVMSIPTLMLFREGKPAASMVGVAPKERILQELGL